MIHAAIPSNEKNRLSALKEYNILDTFPEQDYDNITKLASQICNVPISTVSLVDSERVFLKSRHGLPFDEGPRNTSFCGHAINTPKEIMVIPDSRSDVRFADNPSVIGFPNVVFYAGVPLTTDEGLSLGTLCVIDSKPHQITDIQKSALWTLGQQVIRLMELRLKNQLLLNQQGILRRYANEMEMFAYAASHDLKEPLRMVKSFMHLLENKYADNLDDKAKSYIRYAVDGADRMDILITDLLQYTLANNDESTELTDLNLILADVKQLLQHEIEENSVTIIGSDLPSIQISPIAIRQVFQNLLSNAIKYKRNDVAPQISITVEESSTYYTFSITDNGLGISMKNNEKIFELFKRLHNKREYSGTGIGLALCKKIIERSGGKIWLESIEGEGSTFYFNIKKHNY